MPLVCLQFIVLASLGLCKDPPHAGMVQTVGTELSIVDVRSQNDEMDIKLQLLDTGGHPAQLGLVEQGLGTGHDYCCLVYSVADEASFLAVKDWHRLLMSKTTKPNRPVKGVLIACKTDLPASMHQVCQAAVEELCSQAGNWMVRYCSDWPCRFHSIKVSSWQASLGWSFHGQAQPVWQMQGNRLNNLHKSLQRTTEQNFLELLNVWRRHSLLCNLKEYE